MKSSEHIDIIIKKILKSRKMSPAVIEALASVIKALAMVKEREETPNFVKDQKEEAAESMFASEIPDFAEINNVEINGKVHPVRITPN